MMPTPSEITAFQKIVWDYFAAHGRDMPWRQRFDPYGIVVSEIMLQQTQVARVQPKFVAFMAGFPTIEALATASLPEVLGLWVGLGYNRRAKFLHSLAKEVMQRYSGKIPADPLELATLPGIGPNTAGAIACYAFNMPVAFVETNIRTVLLRHFFADQHQVSEADIRAVAAAVLDARKPRQWHWALMDYGAYIKKRYGNHNARAQAYRAQSVFAGSQREVRGRVIALLVEAPRSPAILAELVPDLRLPQVLAALQAENLINLTPDRVQLAE